MLEYQEYNKSLLKLNIFLSDPTDLYVFEDKIEFKIKDTNPHF